MAAAPARASLSRGHPQAREYKLGLGSPPATGPRLWAQWPSRPGGSHPWLSSSARDLGVDKHLSERKGPHQDPRICSRPKESRFRWMWIRRLGYCWAGSLRAFLSLSLWVRGQQHSSVEVFDVQKTPRTRSLGEWIFETKCLVRVIFKNWRRGSSGGAYLANMRPWVQTPVLPKTKKHL
jgi:hypothetical protein